jgi:hypothetical protein
VENILINFTADPSGLQPGIDGLVQLEAVDRDVAEQVKKTNVAIAARDKGIKDGTDKSISQVEKLGISFKSLDKSITGGAYIKTLQSIQQEVGKTGTEFKLLGQTIEFSKQKMQGLTPNSEEWVLLNERVKQGEELLKAFGEGAEAVGGKTQSFKARLRELKNELQILEDQGKDNTLEFEKLSTEAGKLEDQIGDTNARIRVLASDTYKFDVLISGITGITAAFSVAQGAAALFGDENDDLQKALLKVNAAMAILQGLQAVQTTLQKQSAISIAVENAQRSIAVLQTNLQTSAESKNVIVKYASIAAQKALNLAMSLSPTGIVLLGIGAIAGALLAFSSNTETATQKQIKFNEQLGIELDYLEQVDKSLREPREERIKELNNELKLLESSNASENEKLKKKKEISEVERDMAASSAGFHANEIKDLGLVSAQLDDQRGKLKKLKTELNETGDQGFLKRIGTGDRKKSVIQDDIDAVESGIKVLEQKKQQAQKAKDDYTNAVTENEAVANEIIQKGYEDSLKSAKGFAEQRVLLAAQGSRAELDAKIGALHAGLREELANVNLTSGERAKATAAVFRQETELRFAFDQKVQADTIKALDAKAELEKEGSRKRLDAELTSLELQKKAELQTTTIVNGEVVKLKELTEQQKAEIDDRYLKLASDKIKTFARQASEDELNARIAGLNRANSSLQLDADAATNTQLLENKKALVDAQAQLEIISINATIHNEELRREKVKEVYAKALADKVQLERDKNKADIDAGKTEALSIYDSLIAKQNLVVKNEKSTARERIAAQDEIFTLTQARIDAEALANQQAYDAGLISFDTYLQNRRALQTQADENEANQEAEKQARILAIRDLAQQTSLKLINFAFASAKKGYQSEEEAVKQLFDQKKISEEEYNNRVKVIRRKQAQDDKAQALFTMLISQGPAILKGFQQGGIAGAAAAFALFFSLLGALQGAEVPAFAKGTKKAPAGFKWVGEKGAELIYDNGGYPIIPADKSKQLANSGYSDSKILHEYNIPTHNMTMTEIPDHVTNVMTPAGEKIDYNKLGDVIAEKLAQNPSSHLHFDERGFVLSVQKGNQTIEYKNKKLST